MCIHLHDTDDNNGQSVGLLFGLSLGWSTTVVQTEISQELLDGVLC